MITFESLDAGASANCRPPETPSEFIAEMNKALQSLPEYKTGMVVCADDNGYWLELLGVKNTENDDLLSVARNLVIIKSDKGKD